MNIQQKNLYLQKWITVVSVFLLLVKFTAYYITGSVAILTDALESIVNVVAGFIGLYSLYISAKPRDQNHPYGHGKAEFLSAAIEGTLVLSAGVIIIYNGVLNLIYPVAISKIDYGIILIGATAIINLIMGWICERQGRKNQSLALTASGKHLQSDSYSTFGIIAGLVIIYFTGLNWIDSVVAILFGIFILVTGYRIIRASVAGIMDEADIVLLNKLVALLNANRRANWVDLHNLRLIKFGSVLHVDCHLTVPWYMNLHEAHIEIDALAGLIRKEFGETIELFVHSDGCLYSQCGICIKTDCHVRQHAFEKRISWSLDNILRNKKHEFDDRGEF